MKTSASTLLPRALMTLGVAFVVVAGTHMCYCNVMVLRHTRLVPGILAEGVLASHHHTHVYTYGDSDFLHTE